MSKLELQFITSRNDKGTVLLTGIQFPQINVPNVGGVLGPLRVNRKGLRKATEDVGIEGVSGLVAVYSKTAGLKSDEENAHWYGAVADRMKSGTSRACEGHGISAQELVETAISAVSNWNPPSSRNPLVGARNQYGRELSFEAAIMASEDTFVSQAQEVLADLKDRVSAMETLLEDPASLQAALLALAETNGVDLVKDQIKFR